MTNPPIGRKRGRPKDPLLAQFRSLFPEWSERSLARFADGERRMTAMGYTVEQKCDVIKRVRRPRGGINVSKFDELTARLHIIWLFEQKRDV
jgi:hypothetical protein